MYAQQQTPSTSTSTDLVSGAPVCEVDAVGNQAQLEQAGLDAGAVPDLGLLGDMADMVLDTLPLPLALPIAAQAISEPAVQAWLLRQDPAAVVETMAMVLPGRLGAAWPVGLGLYVSGQAGAALGLDAELRGDVELLRTGADTVQARVVAGGKVGLAEVGAKLAAQGAGSQALAEVAATAELGVDVSDEATATGAPTTAMLLALGMAASPAAMLALVGGQGTVAAGDAAGLDMPRFFDPSRYQHTARAGVEGKAEAKAGEALLDLTQVDWGHLLADLQPLVEGLQGLFNGSYRGRVELESGTNGATLRSQLALSAVVDLLAVPFLAAALDVPLLQALSESLGGTGALEYEAGVQVTEGGLALAGEPRLSLLLAQTAGDRKATDRIDLCLAELPEMVARFQAGEGLSALVGAVGFQRAVELPAPPELVAQVVPDLALATTGMLADNGLVAGRDDLRLVGSVTAGPEAIQQITGSDLQAPEGMGPTQALGDIHSAICALALGLEQVPAWLQDRVELLRSAAAKATTKGARLVGRVGIAAGAGGMITAGLSAGAKGKGEVGFAVDRAVDGSAATSVAQALAAGVGTLPAATVQAPGADGALLDGAAGGAAPHADTGTETGTETGAATGTATADQPHEAAA